jgi:hypothetical protein
MAPFSLTGDDEMKKAILTACFIALMSTPSMAIDFTKPLTNLDGTAVKDAEGKDVNTTLGKVAEQSLLAVYADERDPQTGKETITPEEKFNRWKLATKISGQKDVSLTAEELALIKKLIGKAFPPLVVGQAWTMLDPGVK